MASILRRPFDLLIVVVLFNFLMVAITIDFTQVIYGSILALENLDEWVWPPALVLKNYAWWCETYDPLLVHTPMWFETLSWFTPFLYAPFYTVAIYAFVFEKEWIRIPALMWGYGLLLTMSVVVREELYGEYPTKDVTMCALAYGGYILMPMLVMLRVAWTPVFPKSTSRAQASRQKSD